LGIDGKIAEVELEDVGITCNRNTVPFDKLPPSRASGIRIGSAAMTTRGMGAVEFKQIADLIYGVLSDYAKRSHEDLKQAARTRTLELCKAFPLYE
jgi:glycine hydroxymethyltransferase